MDKSDDCLENIPFTAVVAFILVIIGASIVGGTVYKALSETEAIFSTHFFTIPWILYVQIAELLVCAVVLCVAIMLIIFALVVSKRSRRGTSRGKLHSYVKGGRRMAVILLWTTFGQLTLWVILTIGLAVPNVAWAMMASVCEHELADFYTGPGVQKPGIYENNIPLKPYWEEPGYRPTPRFNGDDLARSFPHLPIPPMINPANYTFRVFEEIGRSDGFYYVFNLTAYGIYVQPWRYPSYMNVEESIQSLVRFKIFCSAVKTAGSLYGCGLGGALMVVVGLSLNLVVMASYKTRLKVTKEYKQAALLKPPNDNVEYI
uniref:Uncharacterized protein n=1 Tax=Mesocestoides corti TaxID=53468 RepID=A0A5K3F1C3_MESCO